MLCVLYLPYLLLLRSVGFFFPADEAWLPPSDIGIAAAWVYSWSGYAGLLPNMLTVLLLTFQATAMTYIANNHRLTDQMTLFPGLFYLLLVHTFPGLSQLSPALMGNTFLMLGIAELMRIYKSPDCADAIFNGGWWLGIASLFYLPFAGFLIFAWISLDLMRAFNWREWAMAFIGFITPLFLLFIYLFLTDRAGLLWTNHLAANTGFFTGFNQWTVRDIVPVAGFAGLMLIEFLSFQQYTYKQTIQVQKKISMLLWALAIATAALFFQPEWSGIDLISLALPAGMLISLNFVRMAPKWSESIHVLWLAGVIVYQIVIGVQ